MRTFDKNNDGVIDAAEAVDVAEDIAAKEAAEREAQNEAARERKISQVFRRFALVLLLALLASVGINAGLTAGIVYAVKDTKVGDGGLLVSSDTGEAIKVASADFSVKPMVAPDDETEEAATEWHRDGSNATTSVLVDANGGAVATAAATDTSGVLVDANGAAVSTQAAEYKADVDVEELARELLRASAEELEDYTKLRLGLQDAVVEFQITGWSSRRSVSVYGVQPTSNPEDSYWALDIANVSKARLIH